MSIFAKFDKIVDLDALKADLKEVGQKKEYVEVPSGIYTVKFESLELGTNKAEDKPMLKAKIRITDGEFDKSVIFLNQVVQLAFQIKLAKDLLSSLGLEKEIEFESYTQFGELIEEISNLVVGRYEYSLEYGQTEKGFKTFKIIEG